MRAHKVLSLLLALVLVLGLSVPAMAAEEIGFPVEGMADFYSSKASLGTETDKYGNKQLLYPIGTVFQYRGTEFDVIRCNAASKPGVQANPAQVSVTPGETLLPQDIENVERYDLIFVKDKHSKGAVHIILKDPGAPEPAPVEDATLPVGDEPWFYSSKAPLRTDKDADGHDVLVFPAGTSLKYADECGGTATCSRTDSGERVGAWRDGTSFALPETGVVYKLILEHPMMGPYPAYVMLEGDVSAPAPATEPTAPAATVPEGMAPQAGGQAYAAPQSADIDGKAVEFQAYALKDEAGNTTNYVKLRDVAVALDGTAAQFNVGWSREQGVFVETGKPYTSRNGQEGKAPYTGDRDYVKGEATTLVDGAAVELQAFVLTDDNGGSSTYYRLRDLGQALGFNVGWSGDRGVFIETDKPYDANN